MMKKILFPVILIMTILSVQGQPWIPDLGNGSYKNPVLYADYSDPDVVRHGEDFYMVSSSFNVAPGLPVLHSRDLVNWTIVNHVFRDQIPIDNFSIPQHGNGAWAPSLRYHDGEFYVYYGDPDFGIFMSKTRDPLGEWDPVIPVRKAKGWIDPCPLWDDDGNAYLVHAFAGSRSGMKSVLVVHRMDPDGTRLLNDGVLVFDGHEAHPTIEGPKFYKRNGYYYIFAPAGGVSTGWQAILRSRQVFGPYEEKVVLHQGDTDINGPHQGGWVELENGESWFLHFQDRGAYGRIVHLQPVNWTDDWPMMGVDSNGDGIGEPVATCRKPSVEEETKICVPQTSDEFNGTEPGLQWQWNANPRAEWMFPAGPLGFIRMYCMLLPEDHVNHWTTPHLLLQKFPAPEFTATTKMNFSAHLDGDQAGLTVMGMDYSSIAVFRNEGRLQVGHYLCRNAMNGGEEQLVETHPVPSGEIWLKVTVKEGAECTFSYSTDGKKFIEMENGFRAVEGRWIGARVGLYACSTGPANDKGYADFDWFRIE
jgi:beta-xylosidase